METQTPVKRPATSLLLQFIRRYREIEKAPVVSDMAKRMINHLTLNSVHSQKASAHLFDRWRRNKKDFGNLFFNISVCQQISLLRLFQIDDPSFAHYEAEKNQDLMFDLFGENTPEIVKQIRLMVLFFENHGINEIPSEGIHLSKLPSFKKRYGNSANWGDYVLGLKDSDKFFEDLYSNYKG